MTRETFESAVDYYQKGDLGRAQRALNEILKLEPNNPEALHLLGVIYYHSGDLDSAEKHIRRSLDLNPKEAFAYFNLANILRDNKRPDEAAASYKKALQIDPSLGDAYYNLGIILEEKGEIEEAKRCYEKTLEIDDQDADAYNNLGVILQHMGKTDEAIICFEKALRIKSDNPKFYYNLGISLHGKKRFDSAISNYQRAIQLNPYFADAYNDLGNSFKEKGLLDEAIMSYKEALKIDPGNDDSYYNLGIVFKEKGQLDEAITSYQKAVRLNPNHTDAYNNLGIALQENKQLDEATVCYKKALDINPNDAVAHWNLSIVMLLSGNFEKGWKEYEWRLRVRDFIQPRFDSPLWDGSDISGRTILLYAEQGFGDTIQFVRYVPLVARRGAKVVLNCPKELWSLLKDVEGVDEIVAYGEQLPDYDFYCPLPSLPLRFGTTIDSVPAEIPYIKAGEAKVLQWKNSVQDAGRELKVGLVWAGREQRSFSLKLFLSLLRLDDVVFYSLQKGKAAEEVKDLPAGVKLIDQTEQILDFSDTAAFIENLDLVISVDTAVAHLAGALGKPVWTLLPFAPDWRWMLDREDGPWYPTMRLFRQTSIGDWESVVAKIAVNLKQKLPACSENLVESDSERIPRSLLRG